MPERIRVVTSDASPLVTCPTCHGESCVTCRGERQVRAEVANALAPRLTDVDRAKRAARREQLVEFGHRVFDYFLAYVFIPFLPVVGAAVFKGGVQVYAAVLGLVLRVPDLDPETLEKWGIGGIIIGVIAVFLCVLITIFELDRNAAHATRPPWMPSRRRYDRAQARAKRANAPASFP